MLKNILLIILGLGVISCQSRNEKPKRNFSSGIISRHEVRKVSFKIDSLTLDFRSYKYFDTYYSDDNISFIGYNRKTHALDIKNIETDGPVGHLFLETTGPNEIGEVMGLNYISEDSIIIADNSKISIINDKGKIIWKLKRNDPIFDTIPPSYLNTRGCFEPGYDKNDNSLIFYFLPIDRKTAFNMPILIKIGLENIRLSFIPFYYPDYFKNDLSYNPIYRGPRACFLENQMVVNFAHESNIYHINLLTEEIHSYGGESSLSGNEIIPMEEGTNPNNYLIESIQFFKLQYDQFRDIYYRVHWGELELIKNGYEYNTVFDKPVFLTVFDKTFNILYETELMIENGIIPEIIIPTKEGLLVFPPKIKIEEFEKDILVGYILSFY